MKLLKKLLNNLTHLERKAYSAALTALFLVAVIVVNAVVVILAEHYEWYFYVSPQYSHQANGISDDYFQNENNREVDIIFCMEKDDLENDPVYGLVWETAHQLRDMYSFINIENVNIYLNPEDVEGFKTIYDQDGNALGEQSITRSSVIFSTEDRFTVYQMSDFFFLSSEQVIEAYNGEEFMASGIRYVLDERQPIAYFTVGHGEQISAPYAQMFVCAGYEVRTIDLSKEEAELDERAEILICMSPLYDFEKAATDSMLRTDMEKLREFIDNGGSFHLFLDPYVGVLDNLSAFIADYGLSVGTGVLRADDTDAVSVDGYTFMPTYASSDAASSIASLVREVTDSRLIAKEVAPLVLHEDNPQGATVQPLLCAGDASIPYDGEKPSGKEGAHSFAAIAEINGENGGNIVLTSGIFMTAKDILQSDQRANRDYFYALMEYTEDAVTPKGATTLVFESTLLEDITIAEIHRYARILILWIPLLIVLVGTVIVIKRKRA